MNKKYLIYGAIAIILVSLFYVISTPNEQEVSKSSFDISKVSQMKKLVFNLPNMDKQMCETFPRIIIGSLESTPGIIDVSFEYDGHVATVYYSPEFITRDEIVNNEDYSWVGTNFISEEDADISLAKTLYQNRESNNIFEMPGEHMNEIGPAEDAKLISSQNFPSIVDSNWLKKNQVNVKLIEIGPESDYNKGHLRDALNLDISQIRAKTDGVVKQVIEKKDFEILMRNLGIKNTDRIVIYSSKSLTHAARLYWTLKFYGQKDIAILDGGKENIKEISLTKDISKISSSNYVATKNSKITSDYILSNLDNPKVILLDVRSSFEFKTGRIPGAINIDWNDFINSDKTLKSLTELEEILNGIDKTKEIIIYCESGTRASYAWFILSEVLGYQNVKLYDGSMIEWRYKNLKIEK